MFTEMIASSALTSACESVREGIVYFVQFQRRYSTDDSMMNELLPPKSCRFFERVISLSTPSHKAAASHPNSLCSNFMGSKVP
jgi:hypothetical protein